MRNSIGWFFNICLLIALGLFMYAVYPTQGEGYAPEHRAELQNKINGLVPLSIADLGLDEHDLAQITGE